MKRLSQRENGLLGYSPQRSFESPSSSSDTQLRNSDVDFQDVFGGPPRRSLIHEMRYSLSGAVDSEDMGLSRSRSPWSNLSEKTVFGEETVNSRRYMNDDFFDDIFKSDESYSSSRRSDWDPSCSPPGSRVISPAPPPLPPRAEPFGTSLPAQFSLPAKLSKVMDFPAFASNNRSPYKYEDGPSNGISYPNTPNDTLSRFSSQAIRGQDDLRNDVRPPYRQSSLSHKIFPKSEESSMTKYNETDLVDNLEEDSKGPSSTNQFHFSIYKWAGRGVPLLMLLQGGNRSKSKAKGKTERSSSSNGRIQSDGAVSELTAANVCDDDSLFLNHGISANAESFKTEGKKQDKTSTPPRVETCQMVDVAVLKRPESKSLNIVQCTNENVLGSTILSDKREETKPYFPPEIGLSEETEKEISLDTQEYCNLELNLRRLLLQDEIEGQGDEDITRKAEGKENVAKMTKVSHSNVGASKNVKKHVGKRFNSKSTEVNEASVQGSPINSLDKLKRSGIKGKVKDFVKIFNQEASPKPKVHVDTRTQSSRWNGTGIYRADYEPSVSTTGMDKKMNFRNANKISDASLMVDENIEQSEKQHSHTKTTIRGSSDNSSGQEDDSSFSESLPYGSKVALGDTDDLFEENFLIKEVCQDEDKLPQNGEDYEAIQVSDAKIQHWSNGKKGNIRSLLSTLQYVLWPESGWKPVPLVDIIEGIAVRKAYQKALLCLHPDKLQQKGAASHQKYIAEKVFDILQEAWDHFNSLGSL